MEIITQDGVWKEHDFNSPKSSRAVAYVMLQRKTAHSALAIADALYPEDTADVDTINKNIRGYMYRFRKSFELISKHKLIEYTSNGYRLNPTLNIKTDLQQFETIWEQVQQDIPVTHKVYMLKRAIKLYKGAVFQSACDNHWLVGIATEYKMKYISMVNELLSILAEFEDYDGVHHFALKSIKGISNGGKLYSISFGREIGIVTVHNGHIDNLYIEGRYQRNGFGTRLLEYVLSIGGKEAYIDVPVSNKRLLHICDKLGLVKAEQTEHTVRMAKP